MNQTNPLNSRHIQRLRKAMDESFSADAVFRDDQIAMVRETTGKHYGLRAASDKVVLNLAEVAVTTFLQRLVGGEPQAMVSSVWPQLKPSAVWLQMAMNEAVRVMKLAAHIRDVAHDAMYGPGIMKVGMAAPGRDGFFGAFNEFYARRVSLHDFYRDGSAKSWADCQYLGNGYDSDYDDAMAAYSGPARDKLRPSRQRNKGGDGSERLSDMTTNSDQQSQGFRDTVRLREVWLPHDRLIVTLADEGGDEALSIVEHEGSDCPTGPFRFLSYHKVPDNCMPQAPMATWHDAGQAANALIRKAVRQAEDQKSLMIGAKADRKDLEEIRNAEDRQYLALSNPNAVTNVKIGGADANTLLLVGEIKQWFSWMAGNLEVLSGLGQGADTATESGQMLKQAGARLSFMSDRVYDLVDEVFNELALWLMFDPFAKIPLSYRIPGTEREVAVEWSPDVRRGTFLHYQYKVKQYSMTRQTPQDKLGAVQGLMQNLLPMAPIMAQQGKAINWGGYIKTVAQLSGIEAEVQDLLIDQMPMPDAGMQAGPQGEGPKKAPVTTRNYVRRNVAQGTQQGQERARMALLAGAANDQQQADMMTRPTG